MNLLKKIFIPLLITCLSSCVSSKTPTTSTDSITDSGEQGFVNTSLWDDEIAKAMWEVTGHIIPYIELADGYEYSELEEDGDRIFYILSKNDNDLCTEYKRLLAYEDYELYGEDSSLGYNRYAYSRVENGVEYFLQFDYYPGGTKPKGFEIFTWSTTYIPREIDYDLIPDWPAQVKSDFMDKFGEIIPLAPLSNNFEYIWDEKEHNFIFTDKDGRYEAFTRYFSKIYEMPEWILSYDFYQQGYIVFEKACEHIENGIFHLNMRHSNSTGFIVDVWYTVHNPPVLISEWGSDVKEGFTSLFGDDSYIPLAPISDQYVYDYVELDTDFYLIDILDPNPIGDFYDQYIPILEAAGFVENDYYYPRFGYYVFEKVCPNDPVNNMVVNFQYVTQGLSIQIYKEGVLDGTGFTYDFPVDQIQNFMSKYQIEYKEFPQFESNFDGRYLYTSLGPIFTIEIYEEVIPGAALLEDTYKEVLEADGWVIDDSMHDIEGSCWGYFARKEGYDFYLRFFSLVDPDEDLGGFVFHLYPNSFDCTGGLIF